MLKIYAQTDEDAKKEAIKKIGSRISRLNEVNDIKYKEVKHTATL